MENIIEKLKIVGNGESSKNIWSNWTPEEIKKLLEKNGFKNVTRVPDERNPIPAQNAVLKVVCIK